MTPAATTALAQAPTPPEGPDEMDRFATFKLAEGPAREEPREATAASTP